MLNRLTILFLLSLLTVSSVNASVIIGNYTGNHWGSYGSSTSARMNASNQKIATSFIAPYNMTVTGAWIAISAATGSPNAHLRLTVQAGNAYPDGTYLGNNTNYVLFKPSSNTNYGGQLPLSVNLTNNTRYWLVAEIHNGTLNASSYYSRQTITVASPWNETILPLDGTSIKFITASTAYGSGTWTNNSRRADTSLLNVSGQSTMFGQNFGSSIPTGYSINGSSIVGQNFTQVGNFTAQNITYMGLLSAAGYCNVTIYITRRLTTINTSWMNYSLASCMVNVTSMSYALKSCSLNTSLNLTDGTTYNVIWTASCNVSTIVSRLGASGSASTIPTATTADLVGYQGLNAQHWASFNNGSSSTSYPDLDASFLFYGAPTTSSGGSSNSCSYTSGNWNLLVRDNCNITSSYNLARNILFINGTGATSSNRLNVTGAITNYSQLIVFGSNTTCWGKVGG